MGDVIKTFLFERKASWIKKKINSGMTSEEIKRIEQESNNIFSPDSWLPDAAKRASQLSIVSHPGKFSHPAAKISPIIAECKRSEDGFLRTGNAHAQLDVFGNAAAMDVFKFLSLTLDDGQTILTHLELNTEVIQNEMNVSTMHFDVLRKGFLSIKKNTTTAITSECVKQVYFPVASGYHLLSILTPSGLVYELRNRIQSIRFSDEIKEARDNKRKNLYNEKGFDELYGLAMIGYGGTKPQNISILNSTYGGKSYLLSSIPPNLSSHHIRLPKNNFFSNTLRPKSFEQHFVKIHNLYLADYNNKKIRDSLDWRVQDIINDIIERMWVVRLAEPGWSKDTNLPIYQKIWLDESRKDERLTDEDWLDSVSTDFARWFISTYEKLIGKMAITLDDTYLQHLKAVMINNEENLL
ncbi:type I-F CRISPR-associated protein Csy1 [Legionella drozanskii]|uniref:CRISPR-associated protein Csy1 n=1 Tax=Legionella drozanskii LLAP-1 TaxID=1212489 RepID=A0A0W0T0L4_9GAMM|nr:type I-F CRISPR-associated protein Csy1 [Legionella drozanskii]KTC89128.1 CRISPR-associated protein Csy1 [Legionella drozanskii LLAP-1]